MRPRDSNWITESAKNLHENRFAVNLDKISRVSTKVKKGELTDKHGCKNAMKQYDMSEIKSRNECKIIGGNSASSFGQYNFDYDINYDQCDKNDYK